MTNAEVSRMHRPVTFTASTTSGAIDIHDCGVVGIETPAVTGVSSVFLEFSRDGGTTWDRLYYEGADYSVDVAASKYVAIPPWVGGAGGYDLLRLVANASVTETWAILIREFN